MSSHPIIRIQRIRRGFDDLPLPNYATSGSAGMDISAAVDDDVILGPGSRAMIPTGIAIALIPGYECQIRPRSGLAAKHGISLVNAPGTIDEDYRGEISVILVNLGDAPFVISRGMKIAQAVIARYERISWSEVDQLPETDRGHGGFGSTGA